MICYDHNKTPLSIGDNVMCYADDTENEGIIVQLFENNKVSVDGETGVVTVNANDCYYLP